MSGISDFKRLNKIGQGAFGIAWLVESKIDFNKYVIKEIGLYKMNEKERSEARKEVSLLSKMNHPNIVAYYNSFEEVGCFHILMEYCEGGDLYRRIKAQNGVLFKEDQVLDYFIQICLALKHIHDQKILHRDIKPQNIFLTKNNVVKLGDFGIAKAMNSTTALTKTTVGTPFYFSPEICEGRPYNNKSDIWSLGCILYELCSLKYAFYGQDMTILAMQIKRVNYNPIPTVFSSQLRTLIDNMFRRRADERPNITAILRKPFILKKMDKFLPQENPLSIEVKKAAQKRPSTANVVSRVDSGLSNKKKNRFGKDNLIINSPYMPAHVRNVNEKRLPIKLNKPEEIKLNVALKQHEQLNKMKIERMNSDRENGWKNIMNSDDSKSSDSKEIKVNVKPNIHGGTPPAAIKQKLNSPAYELYYAELERIKEQQKLREKEGKALMQRMLQNNNDNKPVAKIQNGTDGFYRKIENNEVSHLHAKLGANAGDQAYLVQEYLERKRQAKNIKYRDGSGMAMVLGGPNKYGEQFPTPKQTPRNVEEEIADKLNKIRQKNAELKRCEKFDDYVKRYDVDKNENVNQQQARKALEELQQQVKQRAEDIKQKLEKKDKEREKEREKEKLKENKFQKDDDHMNKILFPKCQDPIVSNIPCKRPSPPSSEASSISVILEKLNQEATPVNGNERSDQKESIDTQPSLSVIFSQLDDKPSRPATASTSEQSEIRKLKNDILKRLNTKHNAPSQELKIDDKGTSERKSWVFDMDENNICKTEDLDKTCDTMVDVSFLSHDENEDLRGKWKFDKDLPSDTFVLNNIKVGSGSTNSEFDGSTITLDEPSVNIDLPEISESSNNVDIFMNKKNLSTIIEVSQEIIEIQLPDSCNETLNAVEREEVWQESTVKPEIKEMNNFKSDDNDKRSADLLDKKRETFDELQYNQSIISIDTTNEDSENQNASDSSGSDEEDLIKCLNNALSLNISPSNSSNVTDDECNKTVTSGIFCDNLKISSVTSLTDIIEKSDLTLRRIKSEGELNSNWNKEWLSDDTNDFSSEDFGDEEIADGHNIFLNIEKIRVELEEKIGIDPLIDAIEFVRENQDLNGDELATKLKQMIKDEGSINDILRLVVLEEQYQNIE